MNDEDNNSQRIADGIKYLDSIIKDKKFGWRYHRYLMESGNTALQADIQCNKVLEKICKTRDHYRMLLSWGANDALVADLENDIAEIEIILNIESWELNA